LASLALDLASDRSFPDLLQLVTDRAREVTGAEMAATSHVTEGDWSRAVTTMSLSPRLDGYRAGGLLPDAPGIYRLVADGRRPTRLRQAELETHRVLRGAGPAGDGHPLLDGWMAAPLLAHAGPSLGVIQVSHKRAGEFSVEDEAVLVQVAQMAAGLIEDRLLRAKLEERVRDLDASLASLRRMHEERRRLIARLVSSQEEERARLAGELHDDPVQVMTAVSMRLEVVRRHVRAEEMPAFERLQHTVAEGIARLRRMMFELRPLALDDGLASTLDHYLHQHDLLDRGSVRSRFITEPPPETRTILYRIAQEVLTSIRRSGGAAPFEVLLSERDGGHLLEVRDQGRTFDAGGDARDPVGLASMRERAELAGGWFVVDEGSEGGAVLRAWIPVDAAQPFDT
jgi:signal transduction histidine kinase